MPHELCKISARSAQQLGGHSRKTHGGCPPPLARVKITASNIRKLGQNIYQHISHLKLVASLLDMRLPSASKKCLNVVCKDALSAFLTMHLNICISFDKQITKVTDRIFEHQLIDLLWELSLKSQPEVVPLMTS